MSAITASAFDTIIQDDVLLPSQFYDISRPLSPELRLVLEVFESATLENGNIGVWRIA